MQRRTFLGLAATAGTARLALATTGNPLLDLRSALAGAKTKGKPLLVLPIEADTSPAGLAGLALGRLLGRGSDEDVALLALCEFQAVPWSELQSVVAVEQGMAFVLLDNLDSPRCLGKLKQDRLGTENDSKQLADWLKELLTGNLARDSELCAQSWYADGHDLPPPHAVPWRPRARETDRAAAMVYAFALENQDQRARWMGNLAQAAAARLWDQDPPGAKWVFGPMNPIPEADPCPACGMAVMPPKAREFLYYYTK